MPLDTNPSVVYWLHLPEHTDIRSEGYIGVISYKSRRFYHHRYLAENGKHENPYLANALNKLAVIRGRKLYALRHKF